MAEPIKLKWGDRKKAYFQKYYQDKLKKEPSRESKNIKWTDTDEKKKYFIDYYNNNKEKYVREKKTCDICGCSTTDIKQHEKTKKHQLALSVFQRFQQ